jgi:hypothetical protein
MAMKLSTGKVAFPIEFDNGDKDCIYFNPNDPNLAVRFTEFQDKVDERLKEFEDVDLTPEGEPKDFEFIEKFKKMQAVLFEELDKAFGSKVSEIVFKHCSPFAIVQGDYFIMHFMEAITPEIEKNINKSNAEAEKRMAKHTAKYGKYMKK